MQNQQMNNSNNLINNNVMKKIFITMMMAAVATASFAQNNPKIDKEIKATKEYAAGLELFNSKKAELNDEEKGKAYSALYLLNKPEFDKACAALAENKPVDYKVLQNAIELSAEADKYGAKDAVKFVAEVTNYRPVLINAANTTEDNNEKLSYSLTYIKTAKPGDQYAGLANFFAAFANYQSENYKDAAKYAQGALGDERVKEQAEQVYRVSLERSMTSRQDTITYIEALKKLDSEKYFVTICNLYKDLGQNDKVKVMIEETLAANPNNKFAHFMLGTDCNDAKKYDEAIGYFKKVIEIDPEFVYGYFNLALCYGNKADEINLSKADKNGRLFGDDLKACNEAYNGAISNLEKVRELDPNHETIGNWPMQLRMYYNRVGQKEKADEISKMLGDM